MKIINCTKDHAQDILDILNEAIVNSTALYDYVPRGPETMNSWFDIKIKNNFPVIGLMSDGGPVARIWKLWHFSRLASL